MSEQNSLTSPLIEPAQLSWKNTEPFSDFFGDIYFSTSDGLEESRYVFLNHNQLQARWSPWQAHKRNFFTLIETGFGTGLNFLATWALWHNTSPPQCRLHYIAVEKHPLSKMQIELALSKWPELKPFTDELLAYYPAPVAGVHRIKLNNDSVQLTLLWGDAAQSLSLINSPADAWFLDGFAPSKNPDMWSQGLFSQMARLSHNNTTFSTFTAASRVRKALIHAGFHVERTKGFKHKREMLHGRFISPSAPRELNAHQKPWYINQDFHSDTRKKILVIGGGLAGTTTAYTLAKKGFKVELIERAHKLANGASGNPIGVLFTKLNPEQSIQTNFYQQSYAFAIQHLIQLEQHTQAKNILQWQQCGMLQLAFSAKEISLQQQIIHSKKWTTDIVRAVSAAEASELSGFAQQYGGLFLPQSGWVDPASFCQAQIKAHDAITVHYHQDAIRLEYANNTWQVYNAQNDVINTSELLVIANGLDAQSFSQTRYLPLKSIRGQISILPATELSQKLNTLLNYDGYSAPSRHGYHCIGATFHHKDHSTDVRESDHATNLRQLQNACPAFYEALIHTQENDKISGRTSFRCQAPDYLPVVGPVPILNDYLQAYSGLRTGKLRQHYTSGHFYPGLYLNVAYGSRGLTSAAFCAEILASHITGEPQPTQQTLVNGLHPARFIIRNLKRRTL